jgi:hypothetical protein
MGRKSDRSTPTSVGATHAALQIAAEPVGSVEGFQRPLAQPTACGTTTPTATRAERHGATSLQWNGSSWTASRSVGGQASNSATRHAHSGGAGHTTTASNT